MREKIMGIIGSGRFVDLAPLAPYGAEKVALRIFRGEMGQISSEDLRGAFKAISEFKHSSRPTTGYGVESLRYGVREELASAIAALIWAVLREEAFKDCIEDYLLLAYEGLVKAETLWNYIVRERLLSQEGRIFYNDAAERLGLKGLGEQIGEEQEAAALVGMLLD